MAGIGKNSTDGLYELNEFIKERKEAYTKAAQDSDNPLFKKFYTELAGQQAVFGKELETSLEQPENNKGTVSSDNKLAGLGEYFQQWTEEKTKFVSRDEHSIVEYCLSAEEWANKAYTHALENYDLSGEVKQILEKQREASLNNLTKLTEMKASD